MSWTLVCDACIVGYKIEALGVIYPEGKAPKFCPNCQTPFPKAVSLGEGHEHVPGGNPWRVEELHLLPTTCAKLLL